MFGSKEDRLVLVLLQEMHGMSSTYSRIPSLSQADCRALLEKHKPLCMKDLDTAGYGSRFKCAVEHAVRVGLKPETVAFWITARNQFLELGGAYLAKFQPPCVERVRS